MIELIRLKQERLSHAKTENEHQQAINSLQEKVAELITRHTVAINEIKEEFYQERPSLGRRTAANRPHSVPEFDQVRRKKNVFFPNIRTLL